MRQGSNKSAPPSEGLRFQDKNDVLALLGLKYTCQAYTKKDPPSACRKNLARRAIKSIDTRVQDLVKAGAPLDKAECCLWSIAVRSICGIDKHNIVVEVRGVRNTQFAHLYNGWHAKLWAAYLDKHGIPELAAARALPPPPLGEPKYWEDAIRGLEQNPSPRAALSAREGGELEAVEDDDDARSVPSDPADEERPKKFGLQLLSRAPQCAYTFPVQPVAVRPRVWAGQLKDKFLGKQNKPELRRL